MYTWGMSERKITCHVAKYLSLRRLVSTHVANERVCTSRYGALLKKMGLQAGVPDFIVFSPGKKHAILLLELKTVKGRLSEAQKAFAERIKKNCPQIKWACAYGFDEAVEIIERYIDGR